MEKKVIAHFRKVDPKLYAYIPLVDMMSFGKTGDYFTDLCESIISQQLSIHASDVIFARFLVILKNSVSPKSVLALKDEQLRGIGISWTKVSYIKDLAQKTFGKTVDLDTLRDLDDEMIIQKLTTVKGIGRWTAEMFLLFSLRREDVFSFGDLGLKNAIKNIYGLDFKTDKKKVERLTLTWSPYRSYASKILWKSLEIGKK